jgi:glutathione peroxidase-family protein
VDPISHGIGRWVPDLSFTAIDGRKGKFSDFKHKKALVVAFIGATCPLSKKFASSLGSLEKTYAKKGYFFFIYRPNCNKVGK